MSISRDADENITEITISYPIIPGRDDNYYTHVVDPDGDDVLISTNGTAWIPSTAMEFGKALIEWALQNGAA